MTTQPVNTPGDSRWTVADYMALDDETQRELIEGELRMTPAPDTYHQRTSLDLGRRMADHVRSRELGECFFAPFDVVLSEETVVQPDFLFVEAERFAELYDGHGITGAPDLVLEVLSPGTEQRDRVDKRRLYAEAGVGWLLMVEPRQQVVEVFRLGDDGRYILGDAFGSDDVLTVGCFAGLEVELDEVWFEEP